MRLFLIYILICYCTLFLIVIRCDIQIKILQLSNAINVDLWRLVSHGKLIRVLYIFIIEEDSLEFFEAEHAISCLVMLHNHIMHIFPAYLSS